ncbi:MAG: hypothetical protein WCL18_10595 [bacterium]
MVPSIKLCTSLSMITEVFVGEEAIVVVEVDVDVEVLVVELDHHQEVVEVDVVQLGTHVVPGKDHPPPHNW